MIKTNVIVIIVTLLVLLIFTAGCMGKENVSRTAPHGPTAVPNSAGNEILNEEKNMVGINTHLKTNDTVRDVVNHPAFKGFGKFILPLDGGHTTRVCS